MNKYIILKLTQVILFFVVILLVSCTNDKKQTPVPDTSKNYTPQIAEVTTDINFPKKEDWILERTVELPGINVTGVASSRPFMFVSDTVQDLTLMINLSTDEIDTLISDKKIVYLNHKSQRLFLPAYDLDTVYAYIGTPQLMRFPIELELDGPTSLHGRKYQFFGVVDHNNSRIIIRNEEDYIPIGSFGKEEGQFDRPSAINYCIDVLFVTDTGNKRIQAFDPFGKFLHSFGSDKLLSPRGISSDFRYLFVADHDLGEILFYHKDGTLLYSLADKFNKPTDVFFNLRSYNLFVAEAGSSQVKIYTNSYYSNLEQPLDDFTNRGSHDLKNISKK